MQWDELAQFMEEISLGAGDIQLRGFRDRSTVVSYKSRTDLVTNIDRESEDYLCEAVRRRFPDHSIVAEEGGRKDAPGDFLWYIDPLDATNNFAHGIPFFCVSLGVFSKEARRVVAGAVYDPVHRELFRALRGEGSFLNGERITVSPTDDPGIALLATGFPYDKENPKTSNLAEFSRFSPRVQGIRRLGSAALDLCYVACGRFDGFWEPALFPWDMAAGSLIVEEAGGRVTNYGGELFDPEYPEILASNGRLHDVLVEILASA